MSSTKRGAKRSPADDYQSPEWPLDRLVEKYPLQGRRWIEPAAGKGNLIRAAHRFRSDIEFFATELNPVYEAELRMLLAPDLPPAAAQNRVKIGSFVDAPAIPPKAPDPEDPYDTGDPGRPELSALDLQSWLTTPLDGLITNPPFYLAMAFLSRGFQIAERVILLERLNFLGSLKRHAFMQKYHPDVYVLPDRPAFTGDGKTDSIEYAWFVWEGLRERSEGRIVLLNTTPDHIRRPKIPLLAAA